jgi:hypothetical protein
MSYAYYATPEQMINRINMYIVRVTAPDFNGQLQVGPGLILEKQRPTITGMALYLGFSSIGAFQNYRSKSDGFAEAVAYGYLLIENHYEHLLQTDKLTRAGEIGLRKVGEWRDVLDVTMAGGSTHNVYISEAIKKWQKLQLSRQSAVEGEIVAPAQLTLQTVDSSPSI